MGHLVGACVRASQAEKIHGNVQGPLVTLILEDEFAQKLKSPDLKALLEKQTLYLALESEDP